MNELKNLNKFFGTDENFKKHIDNLWKTRQGLYTILERNPELQTMIAPQYHTINNLIGVLIEDRPYHPNWGFD